jgi:hypothetical protein
VFVGTSAAAKINELLLIGALDRSFGDWIV